MNDVLSVVEAAYRIDRSEPHWLSGIADVARSQFQGCLGAACFTYDINDAGRMEMPSIAWRGDVPGVDAIGLRSALTKHSPEVVAALYEKVRYGFASEPADYRHARSPSYYRPLGIGDWLGVNGLDPSRHGCCFILAFPERRAIEDAERERWTRVAAHLTAARRLRERILRVDGGGEIEAILTPMGRVEHAVGEAETAEARGALRDAVVRIENARGALRRSAPDAALADWPGLTSARWSLVEQIENDGRRLVLARRNDMSAPGPSKLSLLERQVVALAALAKTNEVIGYELGLSVATVATLMSRAMQKLATPARDTST